MIALALALALGSGDPTAAERAYRAGRFEEAQALFAAALADPRQPPAPLLYNLGNCAYRLGCYAEAAACYRRALLRAPGDARAAFNLRLAERALGIEPQAAPLAARALARLDAFDPRAVLALAAALQTAGLAGVVLLRARAARAACALLVALGLGAGVRLALAHCVAPAVEGVVVAREAAVHGEPHVEWPIAQRLRAGAVVFVLERSPRWMRIAHAGGSGWTESAAISVVD